MRKSAEQLLKRQSRRAPRPVLVSDTSARPSHVVNADMRWSAAPTLRANRTTNEAGLLRLHPANVAHVSHFAL